MPAGPIPPLASPSLGRSLFSVQHPGVVVPSCTYQAALGMDGDSGSGLGMMLLGFPQKTLLIAPGMQPGTSPGPGSTHPGDLSGSMGYLTAHDACWLKVGPISALGCALRRTPGIAMMEKETQGHLRTMQVWVAELLPAAQVESPSY